MRIEAAATALIALGGCSDACRNTVVDRALSPDGMHAAVLFERDCGATTGFSTQVSVLGRDSRVSNGNAFIADAGHGAAATGSWGGPWAELKWIAKDHLLIRYAAKSRIFEQAHEAAGIRISYQEVAPPAHLKRG